MRILRLYVRRHCASSYRSTTHEKGEFIMSSLKLHIHTTSSLAQYTNYRLSMLQDAGSQQIGFLLGSCSVSIALTSEACLKGLPKTTAGDVISFKGWPKLYWVVTEHLPRPPKDWSPMPKLTDDTPAYIEVSFGCTFQMYL